MCAIFGVIGINDLGLVKKMSKVQEFRGPDKQNFFNDPKFNLCIGNNRLSIIDIENGNQPMVSHDGNFIIVFNGTIYNYKELRSHLIQKGIKFKTNSDTEVFVNGYAFWKEKIFNYIDGMWAVAIFDKIKNEIILSRDYLGQKPLFFEIQKEKILFSSQMIGIVQDTSFSRKINNLSVKNFFFSSFLKSPLTLFKSIHQVNPSEIIKIKIADLTVTKSFYWKLENGPDYNEFFKPCDLNFTNNFDQIIENYSISDIAPGGLLSSGMDSFLVNKFLTKKDPNFKTFTLGFDQNSYDEVKNFNIKFDFFNKNFIKLNKDNIIANSKNILKNIDHLCGDSSIIPTYSLIKEIKKTTKVVISGDGGDEAFLGYITFNALYGAKKIKLIPSYLLNILKTFTNYLPTSYSYLNFSFRIKKFFKNLNSELNYLTPLWMSSLDVNELREFFNEELTEKDFCENFSNISDNYLRNAQLYFYNFYLPFSVLHKTDFASMLNSVEYRSPLLSKKIINLSLGHDIEQMFNIFEKKKLMIKIFKKQIPSSVRKIPKHGFAFPLQTIINNDLIRSFVIEKNLINKKFFEKKLQNYLSKKEDCSQYIWNEIIYTNVINNLSKI